MYVYTYVMYSCIGYITEEPTMACSPVGLLISLLDYNERCVRSGQGSTV